MKPGVGVVLGALAGALAACAEPPVPAIATHVDDWASTEGAADSKLTPHNATVERRERDIRDLRQGAAGRQKRRRLTVPRPWPVGVTELIGQPKSTKPCVVGKTNVPRAGWQSQAQMQAPPRLGEVPAIRKGGRRTED